MSTRSYTKKSTALLERVIVDSIGTQARLDASRGWGPARQDLVYLTVYYAARQEKLGFQEV